MLYRVLVLGIVAFWLAMTALLLRQESGAADRAGQPVTLASVWKLLFAREAASNLILYDRRARLGNLHLQPSHRAAGPGADEAAANQLSAIGSFNVSLPGLGPQSVVLHAVGKLDAANRLQRLEISAQIRAAGRHGPGIQIELDGWPARDQWHYLVRRHGDLLKEGSGPVAALLGDPDLRAAGLDPAPLAQAGQRSAAELAVSARRGSLRLNGEEAESFVVTVGQGGGLETTIHVSPLGQVLAVRTPLGYELLDDAFTP